MNKFAAKTRAIARAILMQLAKLLLQLDDPGERRNVRLIPSNPTDLLVPL